MDGMDLKELDECALRHVEFLKFVHIWMGGTPDEDRSRIAVYRYVTVWIPLLKSHSVEEICTLIPPPDIAFVWYCHMTYHRLYQAENLPYIPHEYLFQVQNQTDSIVASDSRFYDTPGETRKLWKKSLGLIKSFKFPFFYDYSNVGSNQSLPEYSRHQLLVSICMKRRNLLWQFVTSVFEDADVISKAVERYINFLKLLRLRQKFTMIPTNDIDLIWRTHMTCYQKYRKDTIEFLGRIPEYWTELDDEPDFSKDSETLANFRKTAHLWEGMYRIDYINKDLLYRGPPPEGFWVFRTPTFQTSWMDFSIQSFSSVKFIAIIFVFLIAILYLLLK